jgi:hypothetical protein
LDVFQCIFAKLAPAEMLIPYLNLCINCTRCIESDNLSRFQLWSSKWSIKDEHKLLSELGGAGTTTGQTGYYDTHAGFPSVGAASSAADIYDTINTMSQATSQNLYTPPLAGSLGECDPPLFFDFLVVVVVQIETQIKE